MLLSRRDVVLLSTCAIATQLLPSPLEAQDFENLVDEPSRADLFKLVIDANIAEFGPVPPADASAFDLTGPFVFPTDAITDRTTNQPRQGSMFGIDISHHQGRNHNFRQLRQKKVLFAFVKATQGARFRDPAFPENWASLGELTGQRKVYRGAYHFLSANVDAAAQATNFLSYLEDQNGGLRSDDLPAVLDLEWDINRGDGIDR